MTGCGPATARPPRSLATLLDGAQQHVFYRGADGNVHHVYWDPAAGLRPDGLWTSDGQAGSYVTTLLSG